MIYFKSLAILMSILIVSLPITYGAISSVKVAGADNVNGIIRAEDTITYTVTVEGNISPELLKLNSNIPFDSCAEQGGKSVCMLSQSTDASFQLPVVPWSVALFERVDNVTRQVDSKSGIIAVDRTGPEVVALAKDISKNRVTLDFKAQDYGFARGDTQHCSGLSRVEITDSGGSLSKTIDVTSRECSFSGSVSEAKSSFSEGHHIITATAYDIFEQAGNARTVEFDIDLTPPEIGESSGALDAFGNSLTFIGPSPVRMRVEVMIKADDLDAGSVAGDFTSLGFENGNAKGSCSRSGNGSRCVFFINAHATAGGSFKYTVTAADVDGNTAATEGSLDLTFDGTGPSISAINVGVAAPDGFTYLLPGRNEITATVSDEGIGFDKSTVFLDLSGINLGNKVAPAECSGGICTWKNIPNTLPSGYLGTVKAGMQSQDLLGNLLQLPSLTIDVKSDKNAPELISAKATAVGTAFGPAYQNLIKTGDILLVEVKVRERHSSVVSAQLDFSNFYDATNGSATVTGACSASEAVYTCTFQTPAINKLGHIVSSARINITDVAGNSLIYDIPIEVLELVTEKIDYWKHEVVCSPQPIDRQVTSLLSQRIFCAVTLTPKVDTPRTLMLALGEVTATPDEQGMNQTGDLLESFELINTEDNTTDPYIVLTLAKTDFKMDKLKVDAVLQIISQAGDKVTGVPENENISMELSFYNMPLGELSKSTKDKINEAVDQAKILGDWVGVLNQILSYGKRLCEIIGTLIKMYGIINAAGIILTSLAEPGTLWGEAADNAREAIQTSSSGVGEITKLTWGGAEKATELGATSVGGIAKGINLFCKAFSCRLFFDEIGLEGVGKIQRWSTDAINTWQTGFGAASYLGIGGEFGMRALGEEYDADKAEQAIQSGYEKIPPPRTGKLNPQDSLIVSVATLCVPGIIFNLQKLRQVFCVKADCYKNQVPTGTPAKMCQDLQQYQTCKYVTGELTQIIPLAGLFNYILSLVREFISNPLYAVDAIIGVACVPEIHVKYGGYAAGACLIHDLAGLTADVFSDLKGIGEGWKVEGDYCENV